MSFRNQRLGRHLAADYTIIRSKTLKVTVIMSCMTAVNVSAGNRVKFARFVLPADLYTFTRLEISYQFHLLQ